jgi:hypothetical protein
MSLPPADPALAAPLHALLDEGAAFSPLYQRDLADHRPMALLALWRLGADEARLRQWATRYERLLEPAPAPEAWPSGDPWPDSRGRAEHLARLQDLFAQWVAQEGPADTLEQVLPGLVDGLGGTAFHGLIRLAAAWRSGHEGELVRALAAAVVMHEAFAPPPDGEGDEADPEVLLRALRLPAPQGGRIADRMRAAAADPATLATLARLHVDEHTLERLSRLSAQACAATGSFTALHLLTATHAMRVLLPFLHDVRTGLAAFWQAWGLAVVAARLQPVTPAPLASWARLREAALASDDDHVAKLLDTCLEEERAWGGDDWRRAASTLVAQRTRGASA